jgi:cation transport ATPase
MGVDEIEGDLLPSKKLERVHAFPEAGHMGSGTAVARESANVVLIGDDPNQARKPAANRPHGKADCLH